MSKLAQVFIWNVIVSELDHGFAVFERGAILVLFHTQRQGGIMITRRSGHGTLALLVAYQGTFSQAYSYYWQDYFRLYTKDS